MASSAFSLGGASKVICISFLRGFTTSEVYGFFADESHFEYGMVYNVENEYCKQTASGYKGYLQSKVDGTYFVWLSSENWKVKKVHVKAGEYVYNGEPLQLNLGALAVLVK